MPPNRENVRSSRSEVIERRSEPDFSNRKRTSPYAASDARSHLASSAFGTETFSSLNDLPPGLRKMRGIDEPYLGERRVPYGRDHERYLPDRGRALHFGWSALKGAHDLCNPQLTRGLELRKLDG